MILLPLHSASLMHKNPQRRKIIHGMCPVGCEDQSIEHVFVEISRSCNFCGSYYIPLFNNELFLLAVVVLKKRRTIFLFQYTVIQSFGVCLQINCLVSIKGTSISSSDSFLFFYLGLIAWFLDCEF